ncbi:tRNA (adenosine(37)-N6)-threonylcarbamoyltransferase complex dimerization subunit type 1 TsaB [Hyphomicrobium methylovorum]|uniref:tRNA (adenosine(37)-N6)-threonylcarbamoyltransferase complex dimerization subunit type 1 TsaB n=1 Tax=Hyphomicrobium methylovorum TaxID=84 RepID=UPI0015E7B573|nr:tRNA (adenosine(37)-N6)-threonylcarbamoyltransferase complex dimerization subunit type 1 TsaB [Hyphomicrobium methylovorum]MBA2126370.1 tRNA (adenosine(37)-N6)-threonylcarbamoyltransferase complex dimerization subunit type 1 TsaB [Hyphomicrobium methylovorum]
MNVLSLDSCFDACSAAAGRGLRTLTPSISFAYAPMQTGHAEQLLPMAKMVMAEAGLEFAALDRIAVTFGPGTFTGTRICVSAARALALATGAQIVALSSLRLMAMSARIPSAPTRRVAIATDARRGEVYLEVFDRHSLATLVPPSCRGIADAAETLGSEPIVVAGSGAKAVADAARASGVGAHDILPDLLPDALDVLFPACELPLTETLRPLYLRAPDAKPPSPSSIVRVGV